MTLPPFSPKKCRRISLILLGLLTALPAVAAADTFVVGGTVHTMQGDPVVTTVVIRDGVIVTVDASAVPGPDDTVVDAVGMVVTPGLIDFDTGLGLVEISAVSNTQDSNASGDEVRAGFRVADALNPQSTLIPITRVEGVTNVVSHPRGGLISGQSVFFDLAGDTASEMIIQAPATLDMRGDAGGGNAVGGSRAAAWLRYRELFADVRAYRDDAARYRQGQMRDLSVSLVDIEALIPVLDGIVPVFFYANRQADVLAVLALAEEQGLRPIIGGGAEAWAVADELAASEVFVVVDPLRNAPYDFEHIGSRADNAALLDAAGASVILTTGEAHNVRTLRQIVGNAIRAGLPWERGLSAVTVQPARALGLGDSYGAIAVGYVGNLVVWSADPFELSTRVRATIIRGEVVTTQTRQSELFMRYRHLPPSERAETSDEGEQSD